MAHPEPKYSELIQPYSLRALIVSEEAERRAFSAVGIYIMENCHLIHTSSQAQGNHQFYDQFSGITQDSIIMQLFALTRGSGRFEMERIPINWHIKLFSFATPVDAVKKSLIKIIEEAARK